MADGWPGKYRNGEMLAKAVEAYFASISRTVEALEEYDTGEKDADGHAIYASRPILNDAGERIRYLEFVVPPTVGGLCAHLGITLRTWDEFCDRDRHPEFYDIAEQACRRMRAWREEQLLTRRDVRGVIFDLKNNFGYGAGKKPEGRPPAVKMSMGDKMAILREIARSLGACEAEPEPPGGGRAGDPPAPRKRG